MIIEIHGGGFKNKGAELMLVSVLEAFSQKYPDVKFCINPSIYDDSLSCEKYNILQYVQVPKARGGRLFPGRFFLNRAISKVIPRKYCDKNKLVRFKDVDALIDISGVRFSDKASTVAGENLILLSSYFRKKGKPVILLPQMFGPFEKSVSSRLLKDISKQANLIFARDSVSYNLIQNEVPFRKNIFQAPDITITTKAKNSESGLLEGVHSYGCIVPNARMFDRGDSGWASTYVNRLVLAAQEMHSRGIIPVILVHSIDGSEDQPIAEKVKKLVGNDICLIKQADDPLETKNFISGSQLLVGSRYHSIVSALSSQVPVIVMGWAHKYETILEDFGMEDFIHRVDNDENQLKSILEYTLNADNNKKLRTMLDEKIKPMRIENEKMWNKVYEVLGLL